MRFITLNLFLKSASCLLGFLCRNPGWKCTFFLVQNDLLTCLLQLGLKKDVQLLVLHYRPRCGKFIVPLAGLVLCSCLSVPAQPCAFSTLSWGHRIRAGKKKICGRQSCSCWRSLFYLSATVHEPSLLQDKIWQRGISPDRESFLYIKVPINLSMHKWPCAI